MSRLLLALLLAMVASLPAHAALTSGEIAGAGVTPRPGASLPAGTFLDQTGRTVRLTPATAPTVLLFADYTCAHLCGPGVTLTAGALHDAGLHPPGDYRLVVIGLDQDGPAKAAAFARSHLRGMPEAQRAAVLLTGSSSTVAAAERALGYHAVYDAAADQFAHDAAVFIFAPSGNLARVLPETASTPAMLRDALAAARAGATAGDEPSGLIAGAIALCYGFGAAHGVYGAALVTALRLAAIATVAIIALLLWRLARRRRLAP